MTWRQAATVVVLLILTTGLVAALAVFGARARALAAEGRQLLSPDAVAVRVSTGELMRRGPEFAIGTRAFRALPDAPRVRAAVVVRGDWSDVPRWSGIRVTPPGIGQALVGSAVPTEEVSAVRRVEVAGVSYTVSGPLGLEEESLLAEDVLIVDPSAFASVTAGRTVLDGPDIAARAVAVFGIDRVDSVDGGANRRTNIDFVSPIVLTLGLAVATMASGVAGVTVARHEAERARVRFLVGQRPAALVSRTIIVAASVAILAASIVGAAVSGPAAALGADALSPVAMQCGVFLMATVLSFTGRRRSWN